jgi:MFS family permease
MASTGSAETPRLSTLLRGRRGRFLASLLLAEFAAAMQGVAYSTVLPVVARDLDGFPLFGATLAAGPIATVAMLSLTPRVLRRLRPGPVLLVSTATFVVGAAMTVFAPNMGWVLAGTVVRGVAGALLGGFGMGALGSLYDARERPRVFALFSLMWLLPSLAGPPVNALITEWAGWRWALAWPAVVVVAARVLMGTTISAVPDDRANAQVRVRTGVGLAVPALLAVGAWGSTGAGPLGALMLSVGAAAAAAAAVTFVSRSLPGAGGRILVAFAALCAVYFGTSGLISLAMIEALGSTVVLAAVAVAGGLVAWSVVGLLPRPRRMPDAAVLGMVLVGAGAALVAGGIAASGTLGAALVVLGSTTTGIGMGLAYPVLNSEPFDLGAPSSTVGALVLFTETAATAWVSIAGGGAYSSLHSSGVPPAAALTATFIGLVVVAAVGATVASRRVRPAVQGRSEGGDG